MKIYPQKHAIKESSDIQVKDIPLAYIDTADDRYKVAINIEAGFLKNTRKQVRPFDTFSDQFTCFFDSKDKLVEDVPLKRKGNIYSYEPEGAVTFAPTRFSCTVNCQRTGQYTSKIDYDISAWVSSEQLAYDLTGIFGDAWKTKRCPQNIRMNGGAMSNGAFIGRTQDDMMKCDFLFFESPNGVDYETTSSDGKRILKEIPVDRFLDKHVNIWLSVDKFDEMMNKSSLTPLRVIPPKVFTKKEYPIHTKKGMPMFSLNTRHYHYDDPTYKYSLFNNSVLLLEKPGKGFIIVTPKAILDNAAKYLGIIYEVLLKVYSSSYFDITTPETWITSTPVDYAADYADKFSKSQGSINLGRIMENGEQRMDIPYAIRSVTTTKPEQVLFSGIERSGEMKFSCLKRSDPAKPKGAVSYYTSSGNIVYYKPQDLYLVERPFKASYSIDSNNVIRILVEPVKSSSHKMHSELTSLLTIPNNAGTYFICANPLPGEMSTVFELVLSDQYDQAKHGYKIATIVISCEHHTKIYDVRIMGGGLPEQLPDNYDMMDIGNLNGRPFRLGSTNIIRLPLAYEKYRDKIEDAVNQHAASGEYNIVVFDDRLRKEDD